VSTQACIVAPGSSATTPGLRLGFGPSRTARPQKNQLRGRVCRKAGSRSTKRESGHSSGTRRAMHARPPHEPAAL